MEDVVIDRGLRYFNLDCEGIEALLICELFVIKEQKVICSAVFLLFCLVAFI